jgi:hypothetical protein
MIIRILEAIDYRDDKEAFAEQFLNNIHLETITNLISQLPLDETSKIENEISTKSRLKENPKNILSKYFPEDQIQNTIKKVSEHAILKYIETISPKLSESQIKQLNTVLTELKQDK